MRENTASVDSAGHIVSASSGAAPAGGEADGADPIIQFVPGLLTLSACHAVTLCHE